MKEDIRTKGGKQDWIMSDELQIEVLKYKYMRIESLVQKDRANKKNNSISNEQREKCNEKVTINSTEQDNKKQHNIDGRIHFKY